MDALRKLCGLLASIPLLLSACAAQPAQAAKEDSARQTDAVYALMLGKSVTDPAVADFLTRNHCDSVDQFRICKETGMALWLASDQTVETVYLYVNNSDGFEPYKGDLPFGLRFYDTMGAVEYKLQNQEVGNAGRPDTGVTPDHMYYRAIYKEASMTIIYNAPAADEDATIRAILMSK